MTPLERAKAFLAPILDESSCGDDEDDQELVASCAVMIGEAVSDALAQERRQTAGAWATQEHSCRLPMGSRESCVACHEGPQVGTPITDAQLAQLYLVRKEAEEGMTTEARAAWIQALQGAYPHLLARIITGKLMFAQERRQTAGAWSAAPEDKFDEWTEAIDRAFPTRSGSHDAYQTALAMVGARQSKSSLVALVNWLLVRIEKLSKRSEARGEGEQVALERLEGIEAREAECDRRTPEERVKQVEALEGALLRWHRYGSEDELRRLAEDALVRARKQAEEEGKVLLCTRPPPGWTCSRQDGHGGPCAATPVGGVR